MQKKQPAHKRIQLSKITLKPVGKPLKHQNKLRRAKKSGFDPTRQQDRFEGQIIPKLYTNENELEQRQFLRQGKFYLGKKFNQNREAKFNLIEDPRESDFTYRKFILIEKILLILSIFYFAVAIIDAQMYILDQNSLMPSGCTALINVEIVCSIFTLLIMLTIFMRYVCINELQIDQKKFYCIRNGHNLFYQIGRFFQNGASVRKFLLEILILLPHPFFLFHQSVIQLFQSYDQIYLNHRVNDILILISISRIYIIMRSMVNLTIYSTPRASRLCIHNRIDHSFLYSVKCLLKEQPVKIISLVFLIQQVSLGLGLKLSQGALIYINPQLTAPTGFENYINCFWCVFITMATVGYGDYYPKTLPGRVVGLTSAMSGIILSSLLIVSLSAYLTMQGNQSKSHLTLARLQQQQKLKEEASQALIQTLRMTKFISSQSNEQKYGFSSINQFFISLKHKIDLVKFRSRKIKALVNNNNIIEEMSRLFQLFKDSLQESYHCQVTLKQSLEKLTTSTAAQRKLQTIHMTNNMQLLITNKL